MRLLLLMEFCVLRFWFFLIYNKLLLNFCLKQIENNGPLINMIYKVLKNSAQGLLSSIHVRLLASELRSSHCFSTQQSMFTYSGFYRCLGVNSRAFCKIFFLFSFFFFFPFWFLPASPLWSLSAKLWLTLVSFYHVLKMVVSSSDSCVQF